VGAAAGAERPWERPREQPREQPWERPWEQSSRGSGRGVLIRIHNLSIASHESQRKVNAGDSKGIQPQFAIGYMI